MTPLAENPQEQRDRAYADLMAANQRIAELEYQLRTMSHELTKALELVERLRTQEAPWREF